MSPLAIEVICTEKVTPSCPTPHHLRHYNFSFQDQINPPVFMPMVLFFPTSMHHEQNQNKCTHLKIALSKALNLFHVLAGRVVDNSHVDCADQGVPYVEARANCDMLNVIRDPVPEEMNLFVPHALDDVQDLPMVIQITHFTCGGLAIAVGMSHKVADALSFFMFLNAWAAASRGGDPICPPPRFESATLFPPKDIDNFKPNIGMVVKEKISTKRFVFTAPNISSLRDKYSDTESSTGRRPTRIEALSAFIWSRFISATNNNNKLCTILHAVNLRTRVDPPLPENYFGNISRPAIAVPTMITNDDVAKCREVIRLMRVAIKQVGDHVGDSEKHLSWRKEKGQSFDKGEMVPFNFTSLCRFPVYEADFGWGKPEWAGSASMTFKNLVVFMDTKSGGGIEAWINLKEEDMKKIEIDKEFLSYISP